MNILTPPPTIDYFSPSACANAINKHFKELVNVELSRPIRPTDITAIDERGSEDSNRLCVEFQGRASYCSSVLLEREWVCRAAWCKEWRMSEVRLSPRIVSIIRDDSAIWTSSFGFQSEAQSQGFCDWCREFGQAAYVISRVGERTGFPFECKAWGINHQLLRRLQQKDLAQCQGVVEIQPCDRIISSAVTTMVDIVIDGILDDTVEYSALPHIRERATSRGLYVKV